MTRRRRILFVTTAFLLLLLLAAVAGLTWVTMTRSGFDWALQQARGYLPEEVSLVEAEGRLIGPITVQGLRVRTEGMSVRVDQVQLHWRPHDLLRGRVGIEYLGFENVDVERRPEAAPAETGAGPPELPASIDLPLALTIDRLAVDGAELHAPDAESLRLDRVSARIEADADALRMTQLELLSPQLGAEAELRVGTAAPYPVSGRVEWRADAPEPVASMAGRLDLGGNLEALQLVQRWREPARATLSAELRLLRADPEWQATIDLPKGPVSAWSSAAPGLDVGAQLELSGSFERASVTGVVDVTGLPPGPMRARLTADGDFAAQRLAIERLRVEPTRPDAWLSASGTVALEEGMPRFDLSLAWNDLAWPLTPGSEPVATSETGRLQVAGTPGDYQFEGQGRAWAPALEQEAAELEWSGSGSTERLDQLATTLEWRGARLEADGRLDWAQAQSARFDFTLADLDPARFDPALAGQLQARGSVEAHWGARTTAELALDDLSGQLNGRPVSGTARGAWRGDRLDLQRLDLSAGEARLQASGGLGGDRVALEWSLEVPQLSQLLPQAGGSLQGEGSVSGDPAAPSADFRLSGSELSFGETRLASLQASGEIAEGGTAASRIGVRLRDVHAGAAEIEVLEAGIRGRRSDHRLTVELTAPRGDAVVVLAGGLDQGWQGRLERAELTPTEGAQWRLNEPAAISWRAPAFELARACWLSDSARICTDAGGRIGDWQASLEADSIPLARVARPWREDLRYAGELGLSVDVQQDGGPITGSGQLELSPGHIEADIGDTTTTLIEFDAGQARATVSAEQVDAMLELPLTDGGELAATMGLERAPPHPLAGRLRASVRDLGLLSELVPQLGGVDGSLTADVELGGTLSAPSASGEAALQAQRVSLPDVGLRLHQVDVAARLADGGLSAEASARSGDGQLAATVELTHEAERGWRGSGTVAGEEFTVVDLPELHATITPDLKWRIEDQQISVNGRVEIPSARVEPRDISNAVQPSPDVVVRSDQAETGPTEGAESAPEDEEVAGWQVSADVRVVLGEEVRVDAFGLDADLAGDIRIIERPGQLTSGTGELSVVEGAYTIYRQTLTIERGRVLFTGGPLTDPGLDIRAVRRPRDVLVGVNVRGTLRQPRVELFSEPPMEESQVLSYLVVGLPLNETSSGERNTVAAAAAALASSRQGERLASELGIDEVTLEEEEGGEGTSLVLGRYLSPRLYVGYGIGLLEQADSVRVRYEFTRQWTLETRSGATSSADLLYSIESD